MAISFGFSILFLLVCLDKSFGAIVIPIIAEVDFSTGQVELYNPLPVEYNNGGKYDAYDENHVHLGSQAIPNMAGEAVTVVVFTFPATATEVLLVGNSGATQTDYDDLPNSDSVIGETFVYSKCPVQPYPFSKFAPEWEPHRPSFDSPTISRCGNTDGKSPNQFKPTTNTINAANNCASTLEETRLQCPEPISGGDPHFVQTVFDSKTNMPVQICYDVSGQSQQSIFILEDKLVRTKVEGVLLDDYYMHQIKINHNEKILKIDREAIEYKGKKYEWIPNSRVIFEDIVVRINHKSLTIETFNDKNSLTIIVEKSMNQFGVEHLDVSFKGIDYTRREANMKKRYGGLIGDIGQKSISIMSERIQREKDMNVEINDRVITGKLDGRLKHKCVLLPFKQLIEPKRIDSYIYF